MSHRHLLMSCACSALWRSPVPRRGRNPPRRGEALLEQYDESPYLLFHVRLLIPAGLGGLAELPGIMNPSTCSSQQAPLQPS